MSNSSLVTEDLSVTSGRALREVFSKQLKLQILESPTIDPLSTFEGRLLHSAVSINGEKICTYVADYTYREKGRDVVEDCKGVKTLPYLMKKKLMWILHRITIRET